jgi:hypothetical protein
MLKPPMPGFSFQWSMVLGTVIIFLAVLTLNEWIFSRSEFVRGINWIYLPGGVRLLCALLLGTSGALGLLIASWIASYFYFFPDDSIRSAVGAIISVAGPYISYVVAQHYFGLKGNLENLTPSRLIYSALICAFFIAALHHIWFALTVPLDDMLFSFTAMFIGDFMGAIIILYALKTALWLVSRKYHSG